MPLLHPTTVDDLLNYRLSCLLDASGAMVTRLCEGRFGITRREWRLVALLAAHGAMSPSTLAERAHGARSHLSPHHRAGGQGPAAQASGGRRWPPRAGGADGERDGVVRRVVPAVGALQ
ncbi:hypothetical protein HK414_00080 [Ramlibacter terrae]|uniref:MarR family transcriptional regulator n=1 Tax=Ramlibacter terrae TaxID=2732511 RepID=A0ABX6NZK6_9BURK|nr:hypothetical protein HK414_00080 [Ramlibacter terrae]